LLQYASENRVLPNSQLSLTAAFFTGAHHPTAP
jgi:hypothetical protein